MPSIDFGLRDQPATSKPDPLQRPRRRAADLADAHHADPALADQLQRILSIVLVFCCAS